MKRSFSHIAADEVKIGSIDFSEILREQGLPSQKINRRRKHYVRTIPLSWAIKAAQLPGKSATVGLVLWYISGLSKNCTVTLSGVQLKKFGIHRLAASRALKWLAGAGLVTVDRTGNKSPRVTILEVQES